MPTVRQLRYFVSVAEKRHFRLAAEACHVTQPTLSMQLRELENRLGVQLIERNRHNILITPVGREIEKHARTVLRNVDSIVKLAEQGRTTFGGGQKVGSLPTLGPYLMPHLLPRLRKEHPEVKIYLREEIAQSLMLHLDNGDLDLIFTPLPIHNKDVEYVEIFEEPLFLALPRDHRLAARTKVARRDLKGETVLILEQGHRLHDQVLTICDQYEAFPHTDFEGTSLDTLRQMVGMGIGVAFLPALYAHSEAADDDEVVVRKLERTHPFRRIAMAWRRTSSRREAYRLLAGLVSETLDAKAAWLTQVPKDPTAKVSS